MRYERIGFATDAGLGARARIGMLVLRTDQTVEYEAQQIISRLDGVSLYCSRLYNDFNINRDTLLAMKPLLPEAARLLPVEWALKSIAYACTSGSMVIGEGEVERLVKSVHPKAPVTNPVTGGFAALSTLGVRRVAIVTPYPKPVNDAIVAGFSARGFEIPSFVSFEQSDDNLVGKISADALLAAAKSAVRDVKVDGVFVSCTSLRLVDSVARIEDAVGLPVTSSNHAMIWHMLRLAGIDDTVEGVGQLFKLKLAKAALKRSA
jgi:maleate isomerase